MKTDEIAKFFFCLGNCLAFTAASEENTGTKSYVQKTGWAKISRTE